MRLHALRTCRAPTRPAHLLYASMLCVLVLYGRTFRINRPLSTYFKNMTAFNLGAGKSAKIINVTAVGSAAERLAALGFTRGRVITVLGYSILSSSVLLSCGAVRLAVRRSLADKIEVGF